MAPAFQRIRLDRLLGGVFYVVVGVWLLVGSRGVVAFLARLRMAAVGPAPIAPAGAATAEQGADDVTAVKRVGFGCIGAAVVVLLALVLVVVVLLVAGLRRNPL